VGVIGAGVCGLEGGILACSTVDFFDFSFLALPSLVSGSELCPSSALISSGMTLTSGFVSDIALFLFGGSPVTVFANAASSALRWMVDVAPSSSSERMTFPFFDFELDFFRFVDADEGGSSALGRGGSGLNPVLAVRASSTSGSCGTCLSGGSDLSCSADFPVFDLGLDFLGFCNFGSSSSSDATRLRFFFLAGAEAGEVPCDLQSSTQSS
jgi:hypothetical protein